jgi:hypothetical protein
MFDAQAAQPFQMFVPLVIISLLNLYHIVYHQEKEWETMLTASSPALKILTSELDRVVIRRQAS